MQFASKYGYNYGHQGSDSEEISDEETETKQRVKRRIRKADSNVISVKFDQLVMPNEMFAGEPLKCAKCGAIMSALSRANVKRDSEDAAASSSTWECEFCYEKNDMSRLLSAGLDEIPKQQDVTFLIEQAPLKMETGEASVSEDDNYLTFCIDVSHSMRKRVVDRIGQEYTRLGAVKEACFETLNRLRETEPKKRVSIVTFSDYIKFSKTGTKITDHQSRETAEKKRKWENDEQCVLTTSRRSLRLDLPKLNIQTPTWSESEDFSLVPHLLYDNKSDMLAYASKKELLADHVSTEYEKLRESIANLRTEGNTALGPGLTFCIGFSSRRAGSQVILCTDGCANVGMGSVETGDVTRAEQFYEDLADQAKASGVTVNVISMEGTDCKLALLGKVADRSNGTLSIVNPAKLGEQFKSILENRIVATNVKARLIVNNKYLYIRDEELEAAEGKAIEKNDLAAKEALEGTKKSVIEKDIGNANIDTEITFEYGVRKLPTVTTDGESTTATVLFKELPFQLQITYTTLDGAKAMRVYTKVQEFTKNRTKAEMNITANELLFANHAQKVSSHMMSSSLSSALYRHQAMKSLSTSLKVKLPRSLVYQREILSSMPPNSTPLSLSDSQASQMYALRKATAQSFTI